MFPPRAALKRAYFRAMAAIGRDGALLRARAREAVVTVLNLHEVTPHPRPFWPPMSPEDFDELLGFAKREFFVTSLRAHAAGERDPRGKPPIVFSFDDGYASFVEHAMPILAKHAVVANQNVIGESVETGAPPWNARLNDFLNWASASLVNELRLPGFSRRLASRSVDEKARFGVALSRFLKTRSRAEREPLWARVEEVMDRSGFTSSTRMMRVDDVRAAAKEHEIGAHAFSHESMSYEPTGFFEEDFTRCEALFRDRLGLPLDTYAFPNGSYRPELIDVLRRRGVQHILLVNERLATGVHGIYTRLTLSPQSAVEARFQALGWKSQGVQREQGDLGDTSPMGA